MNRRALIVADALVASLCALAAVANFVLGEPVTIVAGISALVVGACAALTTCLLIASGGWRKGVPVPDDLDSREGKATTRGGLSTRAEKGT